MNIHVLSYSDYIRALFKAHENKPKYGSECNNCGWCCLAETCVVGARLTGTSKAPCKLLITVGDRHYCKLATKTDVIHEELGIGSGCDAKTQKEVLSGV